MSHILYTSKRYRWMLDVLGDGFEINPKILNLDETLRSEHFANEVRDFFEGRGSPKLLFYYQDTHSTNKDSESVENNHLFLTHGDTEGLRSKAIYFLRLTEKGKPVNLNDLDNDMIFGEIAPQCLDQLIVVMTNVFQPQLEKPDSMDWGACDEEQKNDLLNQTAGFTSDLVDCFNSMNENKGKVYLDRSSVASMPSDREKIIFYENLFEK